MIAAFSSLLHITSHNGPTVPTPCSSPSHLSVDTSPWAHGLPIWRSTVSGAYEWRMGWFGSNRPAEEAGRQSGKESLNPHVGFIWVLVLPQDLSLHWPVIFFLLEFLPEMTENWASWNTVYGPGDIRASSGDAYQRSWFGFKPIKMVTKLHMSRSLQDYLVPPRKRLLEVNFAATCFHTSINKCISHSQGLSKFIKAAGSVPGETDNPSSRPTDSQGEPMSNHRLLSAPSTNLISPLSLSVFLVDSYCVKWKEEHFSPSPSSSPSIPCFVLPNHLSSSSKNYFHYLAPFSPHFFLLSSLLFHLYIISQLLPCPSPLTQDTSPNLHCFETDRAPEWLHFALCTVCHCTLVHKVLK